MPAPIRDLYYIPKLTINTGRYDWPYNGRQASQANSCNNCEAEVQCGCTWNPGERIIAVERVQSRFVSYSLNIGRARTTRAIGFNTPREHNLTIRLSADKISSTGLHERL